LYKGKNIKVIVLGRGSRGGKMCRHLLRSETLKHVEIKSDLKCSFGCRVLLGHTMALKINLKKLICDFFLTLPIAAGNA